MTNYTVKAGENLWNICKKQFKLTNNTEIANKVKEIVSSNNLKNNGNLIFAGQQINLGTTNIFEQAKKVENDNQCEKKYSKEIEETVAKKIQLTKFETTEDLNNLATSSVSIFGNSVKTKEEQEQAYIDYSEKLLSDYYDINQDGTVTVEEFAQKEETSSNKIAEIEDKAITNSTIQELEKNAEQVKYYDENGDNKISYEEYQKGNKKLEESTGISSGNFIESAKVINKRLTSLFAQNLDFNENGKIDKEELAFFNKIADNCDGNQDGIITNKSESDVLNSIIGVNVDNKQYKEVVTKYISGTDLVPGMEPFSEEDKKILEESQKTIRSNIRKASGINLEG